MFLVLVLEGSGYHLDTLLKWVREVWQFLWEVGVRAVVEVPVLEAVRRWRGRLAAWRGATRELGEGLYSEAKRKDMERIVQHAPRRLTYHGVERN